MAYSKLDDYLVHQNPTTLDQVVNNHPNWTDRFYFNCHPKDGSLLLTTGYGFYPNRGNAHAYGKLSLADGRYWEADGFQEQTERRLDAVAGPFHFEILEPMQRWRLQLAPNASGLSFDIEFKARAPLWHLKPILIKKNDEIIVEQQHIQQSAYYEGEIRAGGETISVNGFYGGRDRTWGIRNHAKIDMWLWFAAQFDDRAIAAWLWEGKDGTLHYVDGGFCHEDGTLSKRFVRFEPTIEFDGMTKKPKVAQVLFVDEDGQEYHLKATEGHSNVCVYYAPPIDQGGGFPVDMGNPAVQAKVAAVAMSNDKLMRYELNGMTGCGIFETWVCGDGYDKWAHAYPSAPMPE